MAGHGRVNNSRKGLKRNRTQIGAVGQVGGGRGRDRVEKTLKEGPLEPDAG